MARVSKETIERLNAFIDSLPEEARNKCALCSETLTHITKLAEVQTGAGTATVTKAIADRINETAAPGDQVSGNALREKVRWKEGLKDQNDQINHPTEATQSKSTFNTTNENIDWAKWSWNPVTGCKHGCTYCYARDIANRFYPEKFEPTFRPERLNAPIHTNVPTHREKENGIKNVFVCSMTDLFGDWVPNEWIEKTIESCANNPQWNFIFLTKNPKRYLEFKMPDNSWIGATGDTQARVDEALKVFGQSDHPVKFLSAEPLLENIKVGPEINWLIIGGQSKASNCQAYQPPLRWIGNLLQQADRHNIDVYLKPNLQIVKKYPNEI